MYRTGTAVLTHTTLFAQLEMEVEQRMCSFPSLLSISLPQVPVVVEDFQLDRTQRDKVYYGRPELKLIIEEACLNTEFAGRFIAMMYVCAFLMCFFATLRGGSLAASHKTFMEKSYVSEPYERIETRPNLLHPSI